MKEILSSAGRAAWAAACVLALLGVIEWGLIAVAGDPFESGWGGRILSLISFAGAYALVGLIGGGLLGLLLTPPARRAIKSGALVPAVVCGLLGLLYARAWSRAIDGTPGWPEAIGPLLWAVVPLLCAAGGWMIGGRASRGRRRVLPTAAAAGLMLALPAAPLPHHEAKPAQAAPAPAVAADAPARHVILILADTLRADHLSLYGYPRRTSPNLDAFAAHGTVFTTAIAAKTKTSPSVASLFTGTWPHTHGIVNCRTPLPAESVTLAEILRAAGFATHSIVANANVGGAFKFNQGFDSVDEIWAAPGAGKATMLTQHALDWLHAQSSKEGRFFLYLHYIDPHTPYAPPAPYSTMFVDDAHYGRLAHVQVEAGDGAIHSIKPGVVLPERPTDIDYYVAQYDGEIAYMDRSLGELLAGVAALGLDDETLVVFVSDHGEALSDHDVFFSHGGFAYEDTARVPLIVRLPGRVPAGARRDAIVQTGRLAPTILEAAGLPRHPAMEMDSFWAQAIGHEGASGETFIEAGSVADRLTTAVRTPTHKLVENPGGFDQRPGWFTPAMVLSMNAKQQVLEMRLSGRQFRARYELYDLVADPGETDNLAARQPALRDRMLALLEAWRATGAGRERLEAAPMETMDEEVIRNLKSLGYIN